MSEPNETSTYFNEIGGDVKGIVGDISGGTINQYIITQKSGIEIQNQKLIPGSPYLGLSKFEAKDKDKFFGRDQWIVKLTDYLNKANVLLLLGASGSGKSSLIQAGLIPALDDQLGANQLVVLTFIPDVNPFESFYICLVANSFAQTEAKLAQLVDKDTLINVVNALKKDIQWLIFIDQFEELFTRTPKKERDIFIQSLVDLIDAKDSSIKIIVTMRADFLNKLSPYANLGKIHDNYGLMLTDMDDGELRLAIAEPAARNGVIFEQGLIDSIIADFHQQAGSLPLLQYTLDLLWKNDDIQDQVLNTKTYQDLGGVTGALQQQANAIYAQFNQQERKTAEQIFLELIELEGKEPVNRRVDKSSLEQDVTQKKVLYQLIDNRLLVSKGGGGMATVEVAHEELLRCWKVLQGLIREKEEIIVLRNRLYADVKQWDELRQQDTQKATSELWSGSKLVRILEFKNNDSLPNLDPVVRDFINASVTQGERQKNEKIRMARRIAAISLVALLISTGLGLMAWKEQRKAKLSEAESLGRESLSLFNEGKELDAFVAAVKGGKILQNQRKSNPEVISALQTVLAEGREINRLEGHAAPVRSVNFSPDGKTLASGSADKTIKLWNLETGKVTHTFQGHNAPVRSVSFSPDGKILASGSADKTIKLWNLETGKEIQPLKGHNEPLWSVSFSPDGKTLASGSADKTIKLWNSETGILIQTLQGHNEPVRSVSFSPDGKTLASGSADKTIKLWNLETGKVTHTFQDHNGYVLSVSFSPDGKTLASGSSDRTIKLWNLETGKVTHTLQDHNGYVLSVSFSPDGKTLASGSSDKTIKLWNLETGKLVHTLQSHDHDIYSVSFSPDGKTLASGSADKIIKLWNLETSKEIRTLQGHDDEVRSVGFSPDGKILASGGFDRTIKLWNLETSKEIRPLPGHNDQVRSVSFSPNGKILASGSADNTIKLWNLETGNLIHILHGNDDYIFYSVSFSPDGKTLVSGTANKTIKLWNVETGKEIRTLPGHDESVWSVSFSPNGKTFASGSDDKTIKLWNLETGKEIRTFQGHDEEVRSVSFSPDGKTLASASFDRTIKLWNIETGKEIRTFQGHNGYVLSVSFSPDGKTLASASADKKIKLWNRSTGWDLDALMGRSCDRVRNYLENNTNNSVLNESDRHLCNDIATKQ